jgi:hypothetical protein
MRQARQEWEQLSQQEKLWSNEVHEYNIVKRVHMPCVNPPRVARETNEHGKIVEQVLNYVGRIDDRHEFALLKFIRNVGMLADCKKLTVLQEKTVAKFRVKEFEAVQSMATQVHKAANAIRKHEWPFKQVPKRPEKEERTLDELIVEAKEGIQGLQA